MMKIIWAMSILSPTYGHFQTKEAAYLDSVKGRGTVTRQAKGGETVWVYEFREQQSGNRFTALGMWCDEYLSPSTTRRYFSVGSNCRTSMHGGELRPQECIPGAEASKS